MHNFQGIYYNYYCKGDPRFTVKGQKFQEGQKEEREEKGRGEKLKPEQQTNPHKPHLKKDIRNLILCWITEMIMDPLNIINTNSLGQKSFYRIKLLLFAQLISIESFPKQLHFQCTSCTEGKFTWWNRENCNPCSVPFNSGSSNDMRNPGGKMCSACLATWQRGKCNWLFLLRKLVLLEASSLFSFILNMKYAV